MSKFTPIELEYLKTQRLGRLATVNKNGEPQMPALSDVHSPEWESRSSIRPRLLPCVRTVLSLIEQARSLVTSASGREDSWLHR